MRPLRPLTSTLGLALVVVLALAGCAPTARPSTADAPTPTATPTVTPAADGVLDRAIASTGCGHPTPLAPGTSAEITIAADPAISNGATSRSFRVHVPPGYSAATPLPAVLAFHGHGGSAAGMEAATGLSSLADRERFLAVYSQGLLFSDGATFWASAGPIDEGIGDIRFVANVLDALQQRFCVDPQRIYATGFSNGGGMVGYLACRLAGRIAAFAPASGNFYAVPDGCHPSRPAPILDFHGTADEIVPYNGIPSAENPQWPLPSIPEWLHDWAVRDGCVSGPQIFLRAPGLTAEQWSGCQDGSAVVHYRADGGGHAWPAEVAGQPGIDVIWRFFQAHPLPGA